MLEVNNYTKEKNLNLIEMEFLLIGLWYISMRIISTQDVGIYGLVGPSA